MSEANKILKAENKKWPEKLKQIPETDWPAKLKKSIRLKKAWRSRDFLVQQFEENGYKRLSICRTTLKPDGGYKEGITWEEIQSLKYQCGYGDKAAVEIYPPNKDVVNIANMRHIWILDTPPPYMWAK